MSHKIHRIGIISDTHGKIEPAIDLLQRASQFDVILHAGDYQTDLEKIKPYVSETEHFYQVSGNCDEIDEPKQLTIQLSCITILLLHGDQQKVKKTFLPLSYLAQEQQADVVVFGHTHVPFCETYNGVLLINPGSIGEPRSSEGASMAILEVGASGVESAQIFS